MLALVLGSGLALTVAVGVVLGRLLAVAAASALLALVVVVLRGHVVYVDAGVSLVKGGKKDDVGGTIDRGVGRSFSDPRRKWEDSDDE